jgi:hypothetical protein
MRGAGKGLGGIFDGILLDLWLYIPVKTIGYAADHLHLKKGLKIRVSVVQFHPWPPIPCTPCFAALPSVAPDIS